MARFLTESELRAAERQELARRRRARGLLVGDDHEGRLRGITADQIILDDEQWTGLVDAQGQPIARVRPPVGFRGKGG
jgi:hypothetical protein